MTNLCHAKEAKQMKKFFLALTFLSLIMTAVSPCSATTTFDLWENFPDNQGDNNFYVYGRPYGTSSYSLLSDAGSYAFNTPAEPNWHNPNVYRTTEPWIFLAPAGTLSNNGYPDGVLAWVALESASCTLIGTFVCLPGSRTGEYVYINQNEKEIWGSYLASGATINFNVTGLSLNAGDNIYFGVNSWDDGSGFSEYNDWAHLSGQILVEPLAIPLPPAVWLLGSGLLGLVGFRKKFRH
jgi:hypothetical protein